MRKTVFPILALLLFLAIPREAEAYTVHVDPVFGIDQVLCGAIPGPWACKTIQYAHDTYGDDGVTLQLTPGIFNDNVVIDKRITLAGAGSGADPSVDSIFVTLVPGAHPIKLATGGTSASERMIIRDLRVTGGVGDSNPGNGIEISSGSFFTFDNVTATGNEGNGIAFNVSCCIAETDIIVSSCNLSGNGGTGFRVPTSVSVDGLSITDSTLDDNEAIGFSFYGPVTDLYVYNSTFTNNGIAGIYGAELHKDFAVKKDAIFDQLIANGNGRGIALRIYGGSLAITNTTADDNNRVPTAGDIGQGFDLSVREGDVTLLLSSVTAAGNGNVNVLLETKNDATIASAFFEDLTVTGSTNDLFEDFCNGCGIWLHALGSAELSNVSIVRSVVTGNQRGIVLDAESMPVSGVYMAENEIQSDLGAFGIFASDGAAFRNRATCNNISGGGVSIVNQDPDDSLMAKKNFWGDASGPFHGVTNPSGLGTEVGDNVVYDPWLDLYDCHIFSDDLESGDTSLWSLAVGEI
jgi:hypothetical protein